MRLTELEVAGFRSVATKLVFHPRRELTCLVGANEHGKSNILDAINLLDSGDFDEYDKYVYSRRANEPEIAYRLELTTSDKSSLLKAISAESDAANALPEGEQRNKLQRLLQKMAAGIRGGEPATVTLDLKADSSRHLRVGGVAFGLTADRPLKSWFEESAPNVRLFEPPNDLADAVTLSELEGEKNLPFVGLLKLAGVWDERAELFTGDNSAHRRLQMAGKTLSRKVRRIWSQGAEHSFRFDVSGSRLHVSIEDPTTFDMPSRRSLGFRSFLSFYLSLLAETDEYDPEGFILLFDEPGIHLHPRGQKDLLKELRRLGTKNQIIYTTHSPFMIDRNNPAATQVVKKELRGSSRGTALITKPYGDNWAAVSSYLGISAADGFFPADRVLLVESRSDRLYIGRYMELCQDLTGADLNFLSIADAEDRAQLPDYVRMLQVFDRSLVVLADGDRGGDELAKLIRRAGRRGEGTLSFIDLRSVLKTKKEVSIEDALPFEQWLKAVEIYVRTILGSSMKIDAAELRQLADTRSLGRATADYLHSAGAITSQRAFSKTTVADLYSRQSLSRPNVDSVLARLCVELSSALKLNS